MHALGRNIASRIQDFHNRNGNGGTVTMKLGYHAIPSLQPLHLHIISSDLDSVCVKTRKHVVSFTSSTFFVTPESLEEHLESAFVDDLRVNVRPERAKSVLDYTPMICTRCGREAASVPDWKEHNQRCKVPPLKNGNRGKLLNSLLGWANTAGPTVPVEARASVKRKHQTDEEVDDIY
jgi:hypothetical protein